MTYTISLASRMLAAFMIVSAPLTAIGAVTDGWTGAAIGTAFAVIVLTVAALSCERVVIRSLKAQSGEPAALFLTLQRALDDTVIRTHHVARGGRKPRLLVFPDPAPQALVVRSAGSRGSILLSQGLVSILSEPQIRLLLASCLERSLQRGLLVGGVCGVLAHRLVEFAPRAWIDTVYRTNRPASPARLGVVAMIRFVLLLPFIRVFHRLGRSQEWRLPDLPGLADNALRNYRLVGASYPQVGFSNLYLKTDWNRSL